MKNKFLGMQNWEKDVSRLGVWLQDRYPPTLDLDILGGGYLTNGATREYVNDYVYSLRLPNSSYPGIVWQFPLPSAWAGRTLNYRFYWCTPSTAGGNVVLGCGAVHYAIGASLPSSATVSTTTTEAAYTGAADYVQVADVSLSLSSFTAGNAIMLYVYRDSAHASDTYGTYCYLVAAKVFITP